MVVFDSSKIYEAILKASEAITPITPLIEAKLEELPTVLLLKLMTASLKISKYMKSKA